MRPGVLLAGCLMLAACSDNKEVPEPVRPVLSVKVRTQDELELGRFVGTIQARYESTLGFRVGGNIARRWVDVGATVKPGDVLASLDPTDQRNQLLAAEGDLARVQAQWINAQANARRQQQLYDRGVGAQAQLDIAQTDLKTTHASLVQAKAAVQQARDQLGYSELRTDHGAVVTQWKAEAGQTVSAGQAVVVLARPDIKEAVIDLPTYLADALSEGVEFRVMSQLDNSIQTTATVRVIEPQADASTRTRRTRLALKEAPPGFRLGTSITVGLTSAVTPRSEIPPSALQDIDGKTRVWIVDTQRKVVNPRDVQVLQRGPDAVLLASGVEPGERVVTAGVNSLKPGQNVLLDEGEQ